MEPPLPFDVPWLYPNNSAKTISGVEPLNNAVQWHLYEVIHESSFFKAAWVPV
jgi:hypothetical protein